MSSVDYRALVQRSPAPCFESDADGHCVFVNLAWCELTGLSYESSLGLGWMSVVLPEDAAEMEQTRPEHIAGGESYEQRYRVRTPDGEVHHLHVETHPLRFEGELRGWLGWISDETMSLALVDAVAERDALLQAVFDHCGAALVVVGTDSRVVRANARFCEWMGAAEEELIGKVGFSMITPEQEDASRDRIEAALAGERPAPVHRTLVSGDGREIPVWSTIAPIAVDDGEPRLLVATMTEFADRFRHELHLRHLAHHDPLTGLPNRRALDQWASASAAEAAVLIDLDSFKAVNDAHGHHFGDQILVQVAERLRHCVRHSDLLCRFGGDEFLVLLAEAPPGATDALVERIAEAFEEPFAIDGRRVDLGASVGVAAGTTDIATLAIEADADLYRTKSTDRPHTR
jgi:diguanylate cyclase (GGDEF)-like protein/PAS domain S-box-containing protein